MKVYLRESIQGGTDNVEMNTFCVLKFKSTK